MRDFKIVVVIVAAVQSLVKCVVGDTVKSLAVYPAAVVAVDDLTHEPEIRLHFICCAAQCLHEIKIKDVRSVKSDSVHIELTHPETNHIAYIVNDSRILLIQLDEKVVASPVVVRETVVVLVVAPEIHVAVPVFVM